MTSEGPPLIDEAAATWAARLVLPRAAADETAVRRLVEQVRADLPAIDRAAREWSGLGADLPPTEGRVIGRLAWVKVNLAGVRDAFDPLGQRLRDRRRRQAGRVLGVQLGALLGMLSTKVLGQYVLPLGGPGSGQLVIVGPNLVDLAREHGARADDIRRSVLVHEVTHRLQFDGTPWLGDHLRGLLRRYLDEARLDPAAILGVAADLPGAVARVLTTGSVEPLLEAVLSEGQLEVVQEAQGMMSLLEGHGNAAMYLGSGDVVDDPEGVRTALDRRRTDVTSRVLSAVAGMDMKKRQYAEGEVFVRHVVDRFGVDGLNVAFRSPDDLPGPADIADPAAWITRVGLAS